MEYCYFIYLFICGLIVCMAGLGASFVSVPRLELVYENTCKNNQEDNNTDFHFRETPKFLAVLYCSAYSSILPAKPIQSVTYRAVLAGVNTSKRISCCPSSSVTRLHCTSQNLYLTSLTQWSIHHFDKAGVVGRIILKQIFKNYGRAGLDLSGSGKEQGVG